VAARYNLAAFLPVDCGKLFSNKFYGINNQAMKACDGGLKNVRSWDSRAATFFKFLSIK